MKKISLFTFLLLIPVIICSQELIELKFNMVKRDINPVRKVKIHVDKSYKFRIVGVNSSVVNAQLETKSFSLSSKTPEIIKPLFPGITDSFVLEFYGITTDSVIKENRLNEVYEESLLKFDILIELKNISDSLYKLTKTNPDIKVAKTYFDLALGLFHVQSFSELKKELDLSIFYILTAKELFKIKMQESLVDDILEERFINNYAELEYICEKISNNNYTLYSSFIEKSQTAKSYIDSETFKAEKDVIDLNATLINSYTKDTIYNKTLSYYTTGGFSFDFSTGFFYNNLVEKSYYIEERDSLKNNVIEEDGISFDVSFGALGHFSYKFSKSFMAGLSMGAALSPLDGKVRYLIGTSFLFGKKNKLGLNIGLALVKYKVLSNSVKEDEIGNYVVSDVSSVPTYDKLNSGFYFGLTYNLTSKKK